MGEKRGIFNTAPLRTMPLSAEKVKSQNFILSKIQQSAKTELKEDKTFLWLPSMNVSSTKFKPLKNTHSKNYRLDSPEKAVSISQT